MLCTLPLAALLLGSAVAVPHNHHHHEEHHSLHGTKPYLVGSAAPIVTGTAGLHHYHNKTTHTIHRTIHQTITSIIHKDDHGTAASPLETPPDMPQPLPEQKNKVNVPAGAGAESGSGAETCDVQTVTVSLANPVTVTVTVDAEAQSSPPQPAHEHKEAATKPTDVSSPVSLSKAVAAVPVASIKAVEPKKEDSPAPAVPSKASQVAQEPAPAPPSASVVASSAAQPSASAAQTQNQAPAAPPAAQAGLPFRTKRGIIASGHSMEQIASAMGTGKVSWLGNWYSGPPKTLAPSLTFVPQNYGKDSDVDDVWTHNAESAVAKGEKYFLSFGEPGTPNAQLHMEPGEAAQLWMQKMEPYAKQGVKIGAPGTLQTDADFEWLDGFLQACKGCTIGFLAQHWFWKAELDLVSSFQQTLQKAKTLADKYGGIPIWLDNFEANGDVNAQKAFLGQVVPWLDQQDWIEAYAYVPSEVGKAGSGPNFVDGDAINDLGSYYANL